MRRWGCEEVATLLRMLELGHTARETGKVLGRSRGTVTAKANHLGLSCRQKNALVRNSNRIRLSRCRPVALKEISHQDGVKVFNTRLGRTCMWVIGEPRNLMVCGKEPVAGYSYCKKHIEVAYLKRVKKEKPKTFVVANIRRREYA